MADIRQSPLLDDFNRPDEDPLSFDGRWTNHETLGGVMRLESGRAEVHAVTGGSVVSSLWTGQRREAFFTGDQEVWGHVTGSHDITEGIRMFLCVQRPGATGIGRGYNGYLARWIDPIGSPAWELLRVDESSLSSLDSLLTSFPTADGWVLMRRNGDDVEVWTANGTGGATSPPGDPWTLVLSATDTTYRFGYGGIGTSQDDDNPAWDAFGGGELRRTQIYRYVSN